MSQRTRTRTTGVAARPTKPSSDQPSQAQPTEQAAKAPASEPASIAPPAAATGALPLHPDALARALRAVASELERDPALAERVAQAINAPVASETARAAPAPSAVAPAPEPAPPTVGRNFRPRIVTGVDDALGPGVPDPFALRERLGEPGLREALASLRLGSLRAILREHHLDPSGALTKLNDAEKLRAHILKATKAARKGK